MDSVQCTHKRHNIYLEDNVKLSRLVVLLCVCEISVCMYMYMYVYIYIYIYNIIFIINGLFL